VPHTRRRIHNSDGLANYCNHESGSLITELDCVAQPLSVDMIPDLRITDGDLQWVNDETGESCVATSNLDDQSQQPATEPDQGRGSAAAVILPMALSILILTLCFFFVGADAAMELFGLSIVTATVMGKFAVLHGLSGLSESGLFDSPYRVALLIIYLDLMIGTIAVFNIRVLYLIPKFGTKIKGLQKSGVEILERNPWMRKATFGGVVAFVMFPLSGTGAIGGSLFGRLLGMSRIRTLFGIAIGSMLGSFGMAALAAAFGTQLQNIQSSGVLGYAGIAVVGLAVFWLYRRSKKVAATPCEAKSDSDE
jgi:uncharacterized membrane protein